MSNVVCEKEGTACATIDSVHGYDPKAGKLNAFVQEKNCKSIGF
jgi:hypothetical protein